MLKVSKVSKQYFNINTKSATHVPGCAILCVSMCMCLRMCVFVRVYMFARFFVCERAYVVFVCRCTWLGEWMS